MTTKDKSKTRIQKIGNNYEIRIIDNIFSRQYYFESSFDVFGPYQEMKYDSLDQKYYFLKKKKKVIKSKNKYDLLVFDKISNNIEKSKPSKVYYIGDKIIGDQPGLFEEKQIYLKKKGLKIYSDNTWKYVCHVSRDNICDYIFLINTSNQFYYLMINFRQFVIYKTSIISGKEHSKELFYFIFFKIFKASFSMFSTKKNFGIAFIIMFTILSVLGYFFLKDQITVFHYLKQLFLIGLVLYFAVVFFISLVFYSVLSSALKPVRISIFEVLNYIAIIIYVVVVLLFLGGLTCYFLYNGYLTTTIIMLFLIIIFVYWQLHLLGYPNKYREYKYISKYIEQFLSNNFQKI